MMINVYGKNGQLVETVSLELIAGAPEQVEYKGQRYRVYSPYQLHPYIFL